MKLIFNKKKNIVLKIFFFQLFFYEKQKGRSLFTKYSYLNNFFAKSSHLFQKFRPLFIIYNNTTNI